jgi:hypothetical protein
LLGAQVGEAERALDSALGRLLASGRDRLPGFASVDLAGSRRALAAAVRTRGADRRHTALAYRLHAGT